MKHIFLCSFAMVLAAFSLFAQESTENTITIYGVQFPAVVPTQTPQSQAMDAFEKQSSNKRFMEARTKLQEEISDVLTAAGEADPKKKKREVESAMKKMDSAARKFYREGEKLRRKSDREFAKLKEEKEKIDKEIEKATTAGNEKQATKLAQSFDKKNDRYTALQETISMFNYYFYFQQVKEMADIATEVGMKTKPELLKLADMEANSDQALKNKKKSSGNSKTKKIKKDED